MMTSVVERSISFLTRYQEVLTFVYKMCDNKNELKLFMLFVTEYSYSSSCLMCYGYPDRFIARNATLYTLFCEYAKLHYML